MTTAEEMTQLEALEEAKRRWGPTGRARMRGGLGANGRGVPGRLARYRFVVGNGKLGVSCTILGQGDTWAEAFADSRARPVSGRLPL
jgi:hypothetical protein